VGEAVALLSQLGSDAKLLAGGHSLLHMMKLRFAQPVSATLEPTDVAASASIKSSYCGG
jgi:CO/xanthine dehydrogenase FAD-binding subunit